MSTVTFTDLQILHLYVDEITTFIQALVQKESYAIVLACQVFEDHKKRADFQPFDSEEDRLRWLRIRSRNLAIEYLFHVKHEEQKEMAATPAIRKAIHNCHL